MIFNWIHRIRNSSSPKKHREWSIGIYVGRTPFDLSPPVDGVDNPVLTGKDVSDVQTDSVADPFMISTSDAWYMFFEVENKQTGKGEIGLAVSDNGMKWSYQKTVLTEPFHLSYPYVFEWMDEYYMIPESHQVTSVRLYKASHFPDRWSLVGTLLSGQAFIDSSIFHYGNKWWLFTEANSVPFRHDNLRLFYSDDLPGSWHEHPASPIIDGNAHLARPAGRVLVRENTIIRYTQDCYPAYGTQVRAFQITELTTTSYHEREACKNPVLVGSGVGWNCCGMHHCDPHFIEEGRWIACVDGWHGWSEPEGG